MSTLEHETPKHWRAPTKRRSTYWTAQRLARAQRVLSARMTVLRADIVRELRKYDDERLALIADNVADSAESSVADLLGDVYLAEVDRDARDLHEIERALERIASGTYGDCIDCHQAIDPMRLEFHPHAARCLRCQENAERALRRVGRSTTL